MLEEQIATLREILDRGHPNASLFDLEPRFWHSWWQKSYTEAADERLLSLVPEHAGNVLSIGSGYGTVERALARRGLKVTALPLDSVVGASLDRSGFEVVYGTWGQCLSKIGSRRFDCVLMTDLLHLQQRPAKLLSECAGLVGPRGSLVLGGPNFSRLPWLLKRLLRLGPFGELGDFDRSGISLVGPSTIRTALRRLEFRVEEIRWLDHEIGAGLLKGIRPELGPATARSWALRAVRSGAGAGSLCPPSA
jgi:SAM-dependent methyltransferase